jgi:hypothetical protein
MTYGPGYPGDGQEWLFHVQMDGAEVERLQEVGEGVNCS